MGLDVRETRVEERRHRCARKLRAELGPAILSALDDPDVVEIIVNPPATAQETSRFHALEFC